MALALALIISDVTAARAIPRCYVMPSRCRYSGEGRYYFYAPGRHIPDSTGTPRTGAWGCGATDGKATGRSWGFPNQASASYRALSECTKRSARGSCRVVSCSASVHSYYEAHVTWFADAHR